MSKVWRFSCPAKVNLSLGVVGRRSDGFHLLETVMTFFPLADTLELTPVDEGVRLVCDPPVTGAVEENLVHRAARRLADLAWQPVGVAMTLTKRIPAAAGLGGGSSDAATALLALNELWGLQLSRRRLLEIGLELGADVPLFLGGWAALAEGVGERLTPCPGLPALPMVLINPGVPLPTARVFKSYAEQLTKNEGAVSITTSRAPAGEEEPAWRTRGNDLEPVSRNLLPVIGSMDEALRAERADLVRMSGSGPTVFGLFETFSQAGEAARRIGRDHPDWRVFHGQTFNRHPFAGEWARMMDESHDQEAKPSS